MNYFITQPVYSKEKIKEVYEATKHLNVPLFIGIMPIASYNNALFLHNEVPGIKMSEDVLSQFKAVKDDKKKTKALSLRLSKELIDTVHEYFNGLYIITPFQRIDYSLELAKIFQSNYPKQGGNIMTTITTSNLGFPRLGRKREWKKPSRAIGLKKSIKQN